MGGIEAEQKMRTKLINDEHRKISDSVSTLIRLRGDDMRWLDEPLTTVNNHFENGLNSENTKTTKENLISVHSYPNDSTESSSSDDDDSSTIPWTPMARKSFMCEILPDINEKPLDEACINDNTTSVLFNNSSCDILTEHVSNNNYVHTTDINSCNYKRNLSVEDFQNTTKNLTESSADCFEGEKSNDTDFNSSLDIINTFENPFSRSSDCITLVKLSKHNGLNDPGNYEKLLSVDAVVSDDFNTDGLNDDNVKKCTIISETYTSTNCNNSYNRQDNIEILPKSLTYNNIQSAGDVVDLRFLEVDCFERGDFNEMNGNISLLNCPRDINLNIDDLNDEDGGKYVIMSETDSCKSIQDILVENPSSTNVQSVDNIKFMKDNCIEIGNSDEVNIFGSRSCDQNTFIKLSIYDEQNNSEDGEELSPHAIIFDDLIKDELISDNDDKRTIISEIDTTTSFNNSYGFSVVAGSILDNLTFINIQSEENQVDIKFLEEEKGDFDEKYINTKSASLSCSEVSKKIGNVIKTLDYNELNNPCGIKELLSNVCVDLNVNDDDDNEKYIGISETDLPEVLKTVEFHHGKEGSNENIFEKPSKSRNEQFSDCISSIESIATVDSSQTFSSCSNKPIVVLKNKKRKKKKMCSIL